MFDASALPCCRVCTTRSRQDEPHQEPYGLICSRSDEDMWAAVIVITDVGDYCKEWDKVVHTKTNFIEADEKWWAAKSKEHDDSLVRATCQHPKSLRKIVIMLQLLPLASEPLSWAWYTPYRLTCPPWQCIPSPTHPMCSTRRGVRYRGCDGP